MTTTTTTIIRRTMTPRHGLFSTCSAVLLLCAALLLTNSYPVAALSGDGSADLAWSETTTVGEGSGWEVTVIGTAQPEDTTLPEEVTTEAAEAADTTPAAGEVPVEGGDETTIAAEEETTPSPSEPEPETTASPGGDEPSSGPNEEQSTASPSEQPSGPGEEQSSASPGEQPSTSSPGEEQSSASPGEQPSTSSPGEEQSSASPGEQPSTSSPGEEQSSASPGEQQPTTTEPEPIVTTIAPTPPPAFQCPSAGAFPDPSDCQRFYNCVPISLEGELSALQFACPPQEAFSAEYGRCVRDISSCSDDAFACPSAGNFAGSDDSFYYTCLVNLRGGFHKYIVRCSPGQSFDPVIQRCWRYDWTLYQPGVALESSDLAAIKREQKQLKVEEKLRKKAEKLKEKQRLKQQKLEEKAAKKAAKLKAKQEAKANKPLSIESAESPEVASSED